MQILDLQKIVAVLQKPMFTNANGHTPHLAAILIEMMVSENRTQQVKIKKLC
jgi:hypothetical protein